MKKNAEIRLYYDLISKAEASLQRMRMQTAAIPPEAAGTQLQWLSKDVIITMEAKLCKLYEHQRLLEETAYHTRKEGRAEPYQTHLSTH